VGRSQHSLTDLGSIAHFQSFCESQGIVPLYLVDYPIATSADAAKILKGAIAEGRAEVGVHLHPWVSPPFEEAIGEFNSFSGNLPARLEHAKFEQLYAAIVHNFGKSPVSYRAGRYGVGPNTTEILRNHHIAIDSSARSYFNYEATGGPNFEGLPVQPWWLDDRRTLMEVPLTAVFSGLLRQLGPSLYPRFSKMPVLRGALSKQACWNVSR